MSAEQLNKNESPEKTKPFARGKKFYVTREEYASFPAGVQRHFVVRTLKSGRMSKPYLRGLDRELPFYDERQPKPLSAYLAASKQLLGDFAIKTGNEKLDKKMAYRHSVVKEQRQALLIEGWEPERPKARPATRANLWKEGLQRERLDMVKRTPSKKEAA